MIFILFLVVGIGAFIYVQNTYQQGGTKSAADLQQIERLKENERVIASLQNREQNDACFLSPDDSKSFSDQETAVLFYTINMGQLAYIVYSYKLNSLQLLNDIKQNLEANCGEGGSWCSFQEDKIYLGAINTMWNYSCVEAADLHFSAVIFHLCPVRGDEGDSEWEAMVHAAAVVSAYINKHFAVEDGVVETIALPEHKKPFDCNGMYFVHRETAEAFKQSTIINDMNTTIHDDVQPMIPDWYTPGKLCVGEQRV